MCSAGDMLVSLSVPEGHTRTPLSHLHPNDGVDEEKHGNQEADVGECLQEKQMSHLIYHRPSPRGVQTTQVSCADPSLPTRPWEQPIFGSSTTSLWPGKRPRAHGTDLEGLHKRPEQDADGVTLAEQLDEPSSPEQLQEAHVEAAGVHQLGEEERVRGRWEPLAAPHSPLLPAPASPWCLSG